MPQPPKRMPLNRSDPARCADRPPRQGSFVPAGRAAPSVRGGRPVAVVGLLLLAAVSARAGERVLPLPTTRPPATSAAAICLYEPQMGLVMYAKQAEQRRFPASLTKLMTALLVLERADPTEQVTVSGTAAAVGEASLGLQAGDVYPVETLLEGALIKSANDACAALAEHVAGSQAAFAQLMNARARELGLTTTHFVNCHGLHDPAHVSSARDLARLAAAAMQEPEFNRIVAMRRHTFPRPDGSTLELESTNRLLRSDNGNYWPAADGVKTGWTHPAGRCLVASATANGWRLLCVVLGAKDPWTDARSLLTWGFEHFARRQVVTAGETTAAVPVLDGVRPTVPAVAKRSVLCLIPEGCGVSPPRVAEVLLEAPVDPEQEVGELIVEHPEGGEERVALLATEAVPRSLLARLRDNLQSFMYGLIGLALIGGALVHAAVTKAAGARRRRK